MLAILCASSCSMRRTESLENQRLRLEVRASDASARLLDKSTGVVWTINAPEILLKNKRTLTAKPNGGLSRTGEALRYTSEPGVVFELRLSADPPAVRYSYETTAEVEEVRLLNKSLALGPGNENYLAVPFRLGILVPVEGDKPYSRRFQPYQSREGYSMAMFGAVQKGSALLATWDNPYTDIIVDYTAAPEPRLSASLALRESARAIQLQPLGKGGYVEIAKAYRSVARQRGFLKTLAEKMQENPAVEKFFGAADFKPFAFARRLPGTRSNNTGKEILEINFTFSECADLAEHFKNDLGIDRALLVVAGWIRRGYDNQHPDILPAAPEAGGNAGLIACSRRVKALGYLFGLHDNYQDMYKDAPSFNEDYILRNPDGSLRLGGIWNGGQCWIICSRKSLELASRPQNLPGVMKLFAPAVYFPDTIFAVAPRECYDKHHPMTRVEDIEYRLKLTDYIRQTVGLLGSEEGMEWGVSHADYFEGIMSHKTRFPYPWSSRPPVTTDIIIPLFEIVFGDAIPLYTHQGDRAMPNNAQHILGHILYAEMPLYYFGKHHYWTDPAQEFKPPAGTESGMVFAQGGRFNLIDQFIKNTYEVLSPLGRVTATLPMTGHRFLTADRTVETTRFGEDVEITVNYGPKDYTANNAVLPQYGFLVESPKLIAYYARTYRGRTFKDPPLIVIRSMDDRPLAASAKVRIYRGFGDKTVDWKGRMVEVEMETTLQD